MVLSSFECWATCEASSDINREFAHPRNRSVDFFKPPETNFVSQSCYHGYSRVIDNNNQQQEEENNVEGAGCMAMDVTPISSAPAFPSRKRFYDSDVHEKCKKPKLVEVSAPVPALFHPHRVCASMQSHMI